MTFACARTLRVLAMLALPASAIAQPRSPTVFSRPGTVSIRAAVVLADYSVKPLPLMAVVARRNDRADSVAGRTDLDGRLKMMLPAGAYTIRARPSQPVAGRTFSWAVRVVVRPSTTVSIELTNANASADSVAVVASAPKPVSTNRPETVVPEAAVVDRARTSPAAQSSGREGAASVAPATRVPAPVARPISPSVATHRTVGSPPPRANTSKLILGASVNESSVRSDDLSSATESGGGLSGQLGWGFTKHFALVLDASAARIATNDGDYALAHFDVGARWHFVSPSRALVPFLDVAFSGRAAAEEDVILNDDSGNPYRGDLTIVGGGLSLGGGLHYFVAPKWALGGSLKWTTGEFSRVQFDNVSVDGLEIDATSARFNLGVTWYPMGGSRR